MDYSDSDLGVERGAQLARRDVAVAVRVEARERERDLGLLVARPRGVVVAVAAAEPREQRGELACREDVCRIRIGRLQHYLLRHE